MNKNYAGYDAAEVASSDNIIRTVIERAINSLVNTCDICKVKKVDGNRVDVELLQGGTIIDVPVLFVGFKKWTLSLPIKQGDTGLIIYTKYEFNNYIETGEFTCKELAQFSKNNGLFIPYSLQTQPEINDDITITNKKVSITINTNNEININNEKSSILIDKEGNISIKANKAVIDAGNIELGKGATENLVLGATFLSQINQIITMIKTHTHGANGGGPIAPSPELSAGLNLLQNNILSPNTKVK